jgi:hypothetical protein
MPQKSEMNNATILAIFKPADPLREILRDYAFGKGHVLFCYNDVFDALSRMPIMDSARNTIITARPETLLPNVAAAFEPLVNPDATHCILWLDGDRYPGIGQWHSRPAYLHIADNLARFDAVLKSIRPATRINHKPPSIPPVPSRRTLNLRAAPLTEEELDALLGAGL